MNELHENPNAELVWTPTNDAWPFDRWLNHLVNQTWVSFTPGRTTGPRTEAGRASGTEVFDRGEAFEVVVELPGIPKEKIEVSIQGTRLKIHAEDGSGPAEDSTNAAEPAYRHRSFERAFELPEPVPASTIQAHAENGVLTVRVPKPKPAPEERVPLA